MGALRDIGVGVTEMAGVMQHLCMVLGVGVEAEVLCEAGSMGLSGRLL